MSWRHDWPAYRPRPKRAKLGSDRLDALHADTRRFVARSPLLAELVRTVECTRGRIYLWRDEGDLMARLTPLSATEILLESPSGNGWSEHARSPLPKALAAVERDKHGYFHGLGHLAKKATKRKTVTGALTGTDPAAVQRQLRDLGVPLRVIAEPAHWYAMRREPTTVGVDAKRGRVLVRFEAFGPFGTFGGTCLYALRDGTWGCYTIKPSASTSIKSAETWLAKRDWEDWG